MKYSMICVFVVGLFLGCSDSNFQGDQTSSIQPVENVSLVDTIHILLENGEDGTSWLDIISSHNSNKLTFQTRRKEWVLSISGYGNSELLLNNSGEVVIDTVDFEKDGIEEYVYQAFIRGSTYGAFFNYVVHKTNEWEVFRVPFDRSFIRYHDERDEYLIVSYLDSDSTYYRFNHGTLTPFAEYSAH